MLETNLLVLKSRLSSVEVSWAHDGMELILISSAKDYVQYFIIQLILQKKVVPCIFLIPCHYVAVLRLEIMHIFLNSPTPKPL